MAANSKGRALAGSFGKRFVDQIWAARAPAALGAFCSPVPVSSSFRARAVHVSTYDKNVEDQVRPTVVPDHVIDAKTTKYWGPHPTTGVFGPADEGASAAGSAALGPAKPAATDGSGASVLDLPAWFRPLEGVDKAPYA